MCGRHAVRSRWSRWRVLTDGHGRRGRQTWRRVRTRGKIHRLGCLHAVLHSAFCLVVATRSRRFATRFMQLARTPIVAASDAAMSERVRFRDQVRDWIWRVTHRGDDPRRPLLQSSRNRAPHEPVEQVRNLAAFQCALAMRLGQLGTTISGMDRGYEELLLDFFGITLRVHKDLGNDEDDVCKIFKSDEDLTDKIQKACKIRMAWKLQDASHTEYQTYLDEVFAALAPRTQRYTPYTVHDRLQLLTVSHVEGVDGLPNVPFSMRGTTDVLVSSSNNEVAALTSDNKQHPPELLGDISYAIQVKKPARFRPHWLCQLTAEGFTADWKSDRAVLAIFSNLVDSWWFQLFAEDPDGTRVLHRFEFTSKRDAFMALASYMRNTLDGNNPVRQIRVRDLKPASRLEANKSAKTAVLDDKENEASETLTPW